MAWWYLILAIGMLALSYLLTPRPAGQRLEPENQIDVPKTEEGEPIGPIFGTPFIKSPDVLWFGDIKTKAVKAKGGKK